MAGGLLKGDCRRAPGEGLGRSELRCLPMGQKSLPGAFQWSLDVAWRVLPLVSCGQGAPQARTAMPHKRSICRGDPAASWAALPALGSGTGQAGSWSYFSCGLTSKLGHAPRVPSLCCLALQGTEGRWERCLLCPSTSPSWARWLPG